MLHHRLLVLAAALLWTVPVSAGQVKVEGVHLCCGACVKAVSAAFEGVEGVSNVQVDKDAGTVTFDATDMKAARTGVGALAKAGFGGKAAHEGKAVNFPKGFKDEAKADSVTIRGLHNCCAGCAKSITAALKGVEGVKDVKCEKRVCTVTGTGISYTALIEALHADGLHGSIPTATDAAGTN